MDIIKSDEKKDVPVFVEGWLNVLGADLTKDTSLLRNINRGQEAPSWQPWYCILHLSARKLICFTAEQDARDCHKYTPGTMSTKIGGSRLELLTAERDREICEKQWRSATMEMSTQGRDQRGSMNREGRIDADYEKPGSVIGFDRRGSVPTVISCVSSTSDVDNLSVTSSTPSRFMNFLSRKSSQFKDNLKRTKSANKLDRKKTGFEQLTDPSVSPSSESNRTNAPDTTNKTPTVTNSTPSSGNSLKRTMSLSRLSRRWTKPRANKVATPTQDGDSLIDTSTPRSRLQTARSHESLLTSPQITAVGSKGVSDFRGVPCLDLCNGSVDVRPLHSSVLGRDHCFEVATEAGSKYFACKNESERHEWVNNVQSVIDPQKALIERTEHQLKLCLSEAKNIPTKYKYFCEVCLDKTLHARTTSRQNVDMLFWGEQFDLLNLPLVSKLTINIYREVDKRKKKDSNIFVGYVDIPISDVTGRQPTERWFPISTSSSPLANNSSKDGRSSGVADSPMMRIKAHFQSVRILPSIFYEPLIEFLQANNRWLVKLLEPAVTNIRSKDELATLLVTVLQKVNSAKEFLVEIVMDDVKNQDNQKVLFRANSIPTKAMEAYMKLVGQKYLQDTLGEFVRMVIESNESFEVDPSALVAGSHGSSELQRRRDKLIDYCQRVWYKILNSQIHVPIELKVVFESLREQCSQLDPEGDLGRQLITSCIFLRFLCPAILSPSLFGLTQTLPQQRAMRNLTLIAKTIQGLANFSRFGGKEEYMTFMNDFVEKETPHMKQFLDGISVCGDSSNAFCGSIDLGKESSLLHSVLAEILDKMNGAASEELTKLHEIVAGITSAMSPSSSVKPVPNGANKLDSSEVIASKVSTKFQSTPSVAPRVTLSSISDTSDTTPSPRYTSNTSMTLSLASLPPMGNHNNAPARTRTTMREMQESEQYVSLTSAKDLPVSAPPIQRRPATPSDDSLSRNHPLKQIWHAAETVIDSGQAVDEVLEPEIQRRQSNIENTSTVVLPPSFDANINTQRPLAFANPLFQMKSHGLPPVATVNGLSALGPDYQKAKITTANSGTTSMALHYPSKIPPTSATSANHSQIVPPTTAIVSSSVPSSSFASRSIECLTGVGRAENDATDDARRHSQHSQIRLGCLPSPMSSSTCEPQFFGSNSTLSQSIEFSNDCAGNGMPLRRGLASSAVALDTPPDSPHCVGGCHGVGASRKNSGSQNSVRMGVRSVQRKVQEQEKTKHEYEQELNMLRQQLQSMQSTLDDTKLRLEFERAATERINDDWQRKLSDAEERLRLKEEEADRLKQQLSKSEQDFAKSRAELAHAHRKIDEQRQVIHTYENSRSSVPPRARIAPDSTKSYFNYR